eukprot:5831188-Prymnesium_polylepis.2
MMKQAQVCTVNMTASVRAPPVAPAEKCFCEYVTGKRTVRGHMADSEKDELENCDHMSMTLDCDS